MATDYSSGSLTPEGKTVFAVGCGVLDCILQDSIRLPWVVSVSPY
ncbi:MAG: hypothetical protein U5K84_04305 [Alkalibacterium sp.]|nr:hypothetical protein [Alkalibacterium sp.]